ncbi:MAG: DNA-3-methyladenine glycosylase [Candidatus Sericytochromatia bacterium]
MSIIRLNKNFYTKTADIIAKELLGKIIYRKTNHGVIIARIVETEAYLGNNDLASHSYIGKTERNKAMFQEGSYTYVYKIYGMYNCFNIVTGKKDCGEAVLIRALEPLSELDLIYKYRKTQKEKDLTNGPGKLCQALNITIEDNMKDLMFSDDIVVSENINKDIFEIITTTRIGITKSADLPLRFYIKGNKYVSKYQKYYD